VALLNELRQALKDGELPLHLAVQATPDALAEAWDAAHYAYDDDAMLELLAYTRGATLVRPALEVAFEMIDLLSDDLRAIARDGLPLALEVWDDWVRTDSAEVPVKLERLRALRQRFFSHRKHEGVGRGGRPAATHAVEEAIDSVLSFVVDSDTTGSWTAMAAIWRSAATRQDLDARVEQMIRPFGPPTLEEIMGIIDGMQKR
jgi:hypothetical protein